MKPGRILLVEERSGTVRGTGEFLMSLGYSVQVMSYRQASLSRSGGSPPDRVILELSPDAARVMICAEALHRSYGLPIGLLCGPAYSERTFEEVASALPRLPFRLLHPHDLEELRRFVWEELPSEVAAGGEWYGEEYGGGD